MAGRQVRSVEADTVQPEVSTGGDSECGDLARLTLTLGLFSLILAISETIRMFQPCPYSDMWSVANDIASGAKAWDLGWLWSQHNEHRIPIVRLLAQLDYSVFGGKGISLLITIYAVQSLHFVMIFYAVGQSSNLPLRLRRVIQGLFLVCLFHPSQAENLILPFQVSFVIPFACGTFTFLVIAFHDLIPQSKRKTLLWAACSVPIIAALNLAAGILIWPAALALGYCRRLESRWLLIMAGVFAVFTAAYLIGYQSPAQHGSPLEAIRHPVQLAVYVLTYFNSGFHLLPDEWPVFGAASLLYLALIVYRTLRTSSRTLSRIEWVCLAECVFVLTTALVTAMGRFNFGPDQALAERYRTPVLLYWASLFSLCLVQGFRSWNWRTARWILPLPLFLWTITPIATFLANARLADGRRNACRVVVSDPANIPAATWLFPLDPPAVQYGARLLGYKWR